MREGERRLRRYKLSEKVAIRELGGRAFHFARYGLYFLTLAALVAWGVRVYLQAYPLSVLRKLHIASYVLGAWGLLLLALYVGVFLFYLSVFSLKKSGGYIELTSFGVHVKKYGGTKAYYYTRQLEGFLFILGEHPGVKVKVLTGPLDAESWAEEEVYALKESEGVAFLEAVSAYPCWACREDRIWLIKRNE